MLLKSQISKVFFNYANENSTGIKKDLENSRKIPYFAGNLRKSKTKQADGNKQEYPRYDR